MGYSEVLAMALQPSCWTEGMPVVCFSGLLALCMAVAIAGCIMLGATAYFLPTQRARVLVVLLTILHGIVQMPGLVWMAGHPKDDQFGFKVAIALLISVLVYYVIGAWIMDKFSIKSKKSPNTDRLPRWELVLRYIRALVR